MKDETHWDEADNVKHCRLDMLGAILRKLGSG